MNLRLGKLSSAEFCFRVRNVNAILYGELNENSIDMKAVRKQVLNYKKGLGQKK